MVERNTERERRRSGRAKNAGKRLIYGAVAASVFGAVWNAQDIKDALFPGTASASEANPSDSSSVIAVISTAPKFTSPDAESSLSQVSPTTIPEFSVHVSPNQVPQESASMSDPGNQQAEVSNNTPFTDSGIVVKRCAIATVSDGILVAKEKAIKIKKIEGEENVSVIVDSDGLVILRNRKDSTVGHAILSKLDTLAKPGVIQCVKAAVSQASYNASIENASIGEKLAKIHSLTPYGRNVGSVIFRIGTTENGNITLPSKISPTDASTSYPKPAAPADASTAVNHTLVK